MEFDMLGNSKAFLYDPLGNVLNTTSSDGFGEKPLFYDGYGLPVWPDEEETQRVRRQPFQYKGQSGYYADVNTGLYYCHYRYYDPQMGRWLSRDPIGLDGGVNVYAYCGGDPVNRVDPDGLDFFETWFGQLFVGKNWRLGLYTGGSAALHEVSFGAYTNKTAEQMTGYGGAKTLAKGGVTILTTAVPAVKAVQGARVVAATSGLRVLTSRAVAKNPTLTRKQRNALIKNPHLEAAFKGERLDTMLKQDVAGDKILKLLRVQTTPRFKSGPDFYLKDGFFQGKGRWWDLTKESCWGPT